MKLSKAYEPMQYEQDIYDLWEKSGAFQVKPAKPEDSFSAVMPPPNANGNLHLGHALDIALKDTIIRHQRMKGKQALFLPGMILPRISTHAETTDAPQHASGADRR